MKFNMNSNVKVKLTERGHKILQDNIDAINKMYPKAKMEYKRKETDENGYTKFQLHDLMSTFGEHIRLGFNEQPFDIDIIFPDETKDN